MKRCIAPVVTLVVLTAPAIQLLADQAPPDVLAVAPADAWAVVCVRQMGELDGKLNSLIQQANVPFPFQNPVALALSHFGFLSGLDTAGGVGLVLLPAPSFQAIQEQAVLVVPTKDFAELVSLIEPEDFEPGISKGMLQGNEAYIAQKRDHALFGTSVDSVKKVLASKASVRSKLNAHLLKHYEKDDLIVWLNAEGVTAGDAFKAMIPVLEGMNIDSTMLTQMRSAMLSLRLSPAGIGLGLYTESIPGTDAHKIMISQKGTTDSLLLGLPKDRYVLGYGGLSGKQASEMGAEMLAKVLDMPQLQALPIDPAVIQQLRDPLVSMVQSMRSLSLGVSGLPEGPDGLVSMAKVVGVDGDPKQALAAIAELVAVLKEGLAAHPQAAGLLNAVTYKPAAETIGEISVDHLTLDLMNFAGEENVEATQEWSAVISKVLGKDGILFRMGVVDSNHVIMTFGGGAERFKAVAALVKGKQAPLAQDGGVQRSAAHLPSMRSAEGYFAVDQLLNLVSAIAKAADQPIPPISLGELNAPIAFATEPVERGGSQAELFVPMELMIALKDLAMNMMGGAGGAGGPQTTHPPARSQGE